MDYLDVGGFEPEDTEEELAEEMDGFMAEDDDEIEFLDGGLSD